VILKHVGSCMGTSRESRTSMSTRVLTQMREQETIRFAA
jgi:hypothetical protein